MAYPMKKLVNLVPLAFPVLLTIYRCPGKRLSIPTISAVVMIDLQRGGTSVESVCAEYYDMQTRQVFESTP